jgi:cholesterol transport system auxiliary component
MKKYIIKTCVRAGLFFIIAVVFTGCFGRTKAPYVVDQFTLDYASPAIASLISINEFIRIERFSVAQSFNSTAMVYKPQAYRFDAYPYSRWRVNPGDLLSDFLIRDIRKTSLFKGVFSDYSDEPVRFVLEGAIEEFFESDEGPNTAVLVVNVTLLDRKEKEITKKLLFQKTYRFATPLQERSPEGLAKGMSSAMAFFSEQLIKDLDSTFKTKDQR